MYSMIILRKYFESVCIWADRTLLCTDVYAFNTNMISFGFGFLKTINEMIYIHSILIHISLWFLSSSLPDPSGRVGVHSKCRNSSGCNHAIEIEIFLNRKRKVFAVCQISLVSCFFLRLCGSFLHSRGARKYLICIKIQSFWSHLSSSLSHSWQIFVLLKPKLNEMSNGISMNCDNCKLIGLHFARQMNPSEFHTTLPHYC